MIRRPVRRFAVAVFPEVIAVATVEHDRSVTVMHCEDGFYSTALEQLLSLSQKVAPDEIVLTVPGPLRATNERAESIVARIIENIGCPRVFVATADDVQDIEHDLGSAKAAERWARLSTREMNGVVRLLTAVRAAQRADMPLGEPFCPCTEANEIALAACEARDATLN